MLTPSVCPWCGFAPAEQLVLSVGSAPPISIACVSGAEIRQYHFSARVGDRRTIGTVRGDGDILHLLNSGSTAWTVHDHSSAAASVPPGGSVPLGTAVVIETELGPIRPQQLRFETPSSQLPSESSS